MNKRNLLIVALCVLATMLFSISCDHSEHDSANIDLVEKAILEIYNNRNLDLADEIVATDAILQDNQTKSQGTGPEAIKQNVKWNMGYAPDFKLTINDIFTSGDKVAVQWTYSGTSEEFNKEFKFVGIAIVHCKDGKITNILRTHNWADVYSQLGFTITPPQASE